ncbi:---NA---, partial [Paramuricea clavata]
QVKPPSNGTKLIFLPGSTVKIDWSYVGDISKVNLRVWYFKTSESSQLGELTVLFLDRDPEPKNTTLIPRFEIEKPATLVLKNVDETYNEIFIFLLRNQYPLQSYLSEVVVIIAKKPTVTLSCSSPITVNERDNVTCLCRGKGGNPPANVTWHDKDGVQMGGTGKEEQTLTLSETYKCVAKSHTLTDEKSIEIIVYLTRTTNAPTTKGFGAGKAALEANRSGTVWYMVVVILVSGIIIGILLSYNIVSCSGRKFRNREPQSTLEPKTTKVDTTYQELDLSKMNTEDNNYQSLRVNAANDEDSTYTELSKTRDVEDNYQSLT